MTRYLPRDRAAIAAAVIAPLAAAAILLPFRASWPNTNVALLLVVVVVAVAAIGNRVAGAVAAIGAAVWFDFFFTLPYERFTIRSSADVTTFVLLLIVGVAVSQLAAYARRLKVVAITDAGYLAQIHQAAALTQTAKSPEDVVEHVRKQLASVLGDEFDVVATVRDGAELVAASKRLRPDVIVTDLSMPGLDGFEALQQLKEAGVDSPVIFLTMHGDPETATEALRVGASGFVLKHSAGEELAIAIDQVLQGRLYLSSMISEEIARMRTKS